MEAIFSLAGKNRGYENVFVVRRESTGSIRFNCAKH